MKLSWNISWHQVITAIIVGFLMGALYGQWHAKEYHHKFWKKGDMKERMVERFSKELHLTPDQKKQVTAIFEAAHPQMLALKAEMRPKYEALKNSTQVEIRKILDPDQQKQLDDINAKMDERWKKRYERFNS